MYRGENAKVSSCVFLLCFSFIFIQPLHSHRTLLSPNGWDFAHTKQFPVTLGWCLTSQPNTDTIYSEITLSLARISSTRFSHPDLQCQSQVSDARFLSVLLTSVQFSRSVMSDSLWPHESKHARPPCPSPTPVFTQTHIHRVSGAIQPSHPLSSPSPPTPNPSQHQSLFQWVNSSHELAKVLEFQLQHHPSKEIPGLISFRMDWLDLLAVQGTLKSLLLLNCGASDLILHKSEVHKTAHGTQENCLLMFTGLM